MSTNIPSSAPAGGGWRTIDGLDLPSTQKVNNSLQGQTKELDLAQKIRKPISVTAKKAEEYIRHTENIVLFPLHADSMPKYSHVIAVANSTELTCKSMKDKIRNEIETLRNDVEYNGLHVVNEFIKFYELEHKLDPSKPPVEIFHRFQPHSKDEASTGGTTCVGKSHEIVKRLALIDVKAHVIVNSKGPNAGPIHAAVAVPCKDGVLLIEVEHDIPILELRANETYMRFYPGTPSKLHPRLTEPEQPDLTVSIGIVEVPGNYKTDVPLIVKRENFAKETKLKKNSYMQFVLRPDTNPDQSVMKRWLVDADFYPVSSVTKEGKEQHAIKVKVGEDYEEITFSLGNKKFRIPLKAFQLIPDPANPSQKIRVIDRNALKEDAKLKLSKEQLDEYRDIILGKEGETLGGEFFKAFKTSKELLIDQMFAIATNKSMLQDLRKNMKTD